MQTNSISGRRKAGRGTERNIQTTTGWGVGRVWESGRQSPAQGRGSKRDKGKQAAGEREKARNRRTDGEKERERNRQTREIHDLPLSNNGSSCGAQLSRRAAGIRNVECGIFRLGSDSYCLGVIFRVDTGSLWHAREHMDGAVAFMCSGTCKELQINVKSSLRFTLSIPQTPKIAVGRYPVLLLKNPLFMS